MNYAPHKYSGHGPFARVAIWRSKYPAPGVWQRNAVRASRIAGILATQSAWLIANPFVGIYHPLQAGAS